MYIEWLKDRRKRIYVSVLAGMAAAVLTVGIPQRESRLAWWGTLYPEFCFSELPDRTEKENPQEDRAILPEQEVKISFWLAKALDW